MRFKLAACGLLVVLAHATAVGQKDDSKTVLALRRLNLVDRGRIVGTLQVTEDGSPVLEFLNREGKRTLVISSDEREGPTISVNTPDGTPRIRFRCGHDGTATFAIRAGGVHDVYELRASTDGSVVQEFSDAAGRPRIRSQVTTDGLSQNSILYEKGSPAYVASVSRDGATTQIYYGQDGKIRASFGTDSEGSTHLDFFDVRGKRRSGIGAESDGRAGLTVLDGSGHTRLEISVPRSGEPRLMLNHPDGSEAIGLSNENSGRSRIRLTDPLGNVGIALGVDAKGQPSFDLAPVSGLKRKGDDH